MERFIPYIVQYVPACPSFTIKSQTLVIADDFCRRTGIWKIKVTGTAVGGETTIDVTSDLPTNSQIIRAELLLNRNQYYNWDIASNVITFDDELTENDEYEISLFFAPTKTANSLPDFLYNNWFLALASGVKADIMLMPAKEWSNPQLAAVEKQAYMYYVGQAKGLSSRRHKHQSQFMTIRSSWA
jgi:hypothetical protein